MRVLLVHVPYRHFGGEDVHLETLQKAYRQLGFSVETYPQSRHAPTGILGPSLQALRGDTPPSDFLELWKKFQPDFLHIQNIHPILGPAFLKWALQNNIRMVMTAHNHRHFCTNGVALRDGRPCFKCEAKPGGLWPIVHNCNGDLKRTLYHAAALHQIVTRDLWKTAIERTIVPSPYLQEVLIRQGHPPDRVHLMMNPLDDQLVELSKKPAVAPRFDFFYAGRLSPEKGIQILLKTIEANPQFKFGIAGGGPLEPSLRATLGRVQNLEFFGALPREKVWENIALSRATLLPSICNEILPTFALESFALGKRCVMFNQKSLSWFGAPPFGGVLVEEANAERLSEGLRQVEESRLPNKEEIQKKCSFAQFCLELQALVNR